MRYFILILFITAGFSLAVTIDSTSFEEPAVYAGPYIDTGDSSLDHALVNNTDQPLVNYLSVGGELGFSAYYTNTHDGDGLNDGDDIGVTDYTGEVAAYIDGDQGYRLSDCDGMVTITIDEVNLSTFTNESVSLYYYLSETGWESADNARIWLIADGSTEIDLLNTAGSDIDDLEIEGSWNLLTYDISAFTSVVLKFQLDCNAGTENLYIDDIKFEGDFASDIERVDNSGLITEFKLHGNYPNPFNPSTTLQFDVPRQVDNLDLSIYNITGQKIATLYNGSAAQGIYQYTWNGYTNANSMAPSGVYFAVLNTADFSQSIKMMLIK